MISKRDSLFIEMLFLVVLGIYLSHGTLRYIPIEFVFADCDLSLMILIDSLVT